MSADRGFWPYLDLSFLSKHFCRNTELLEMAVVDPVFQSLLDDNSDTGGLEGLWRVQKLELVPVPKRLVRHWKSIIKIIKFPSASSGSFTRVIATCSMIRRRRWSM